MTDKSKHEHDPNCACCQSGPDDFLNKLAQEIARNGHAVVPTSIEVPAGLVPMGYTVGMAQHDLPELVMFGIRDPRAVRHVLNHLVARLRNGDVRTAVAVPGVFAKVDVYIMPVSGQRAAEHIIMLGDGAAREVGALQIVLPDDKGLFPWDDGFDERMRAAPLLYLAPSETPVRPVPTHPDGDDVFTPEQRASFDAAAEAADDAIERASAPGQD